MYAIYGNIYHQDTPNVRIYTIHGSYGLENIKVGFQSFKVWRQNRLRPARTRCSLSSAVGMHMLRETPVEM